MDFNGDHPVDHFPETGIFRTRPHQRLTHVRNTFSILYIPATSSIRDNPLNYVVLPIFLCVKRKKIKKYWSRFLQGLQNYIIETVVASLSTLGTTIQGQTTSGSRKLDNIYRTGIYLLCTVVIAFWQVKNINDLNVRRYNLFL